MTVVMLMIVVMMTDDADSGDDDNDDDNGDDNADDDMTLVLLMMMTLVMMTDDDDSGNPTHQINFDHVQVLAKTEKYFPRLIQEPIEIHKRPDNFNREDSYRLSSTWTKRLKDCTTPANYSHCSNTANRGQ